MDIKERWQGFKHRFKIFVWYLITEPWHQLMDMLELVYNLLQKLNKTLTWAYIAVTFLILSLFTGKRYVAGVFLLFLLFVVLLWEWQCGHFMYRHRQSIKARVAKEAKKNERTTRNTRTKKR